MYSDRIYTTYLCFKQGFASQNRKRTPKRDLKIRTGLKMSQLTFFSVQHHIHRNHWFIAPNLYFFPPKHFIMPFHLTPLLY